MARRRTMTEEDEIQLVNKNEEDEESFGESGDAEGGPPCIKLTFGDADESEAPRVQDELHIKHPGRIKMKLRKLRSPRSKRWCWWISLAILGALTIVFIATPLGLWSDVPKESCQDYESDNEASEPYPFLFEENSGRFLLCKKGEEQVEGFLGKNHRYIREDRVDVYDYSQESQLNITRLNENCLRMEWRGISSQELPLKDCFVMDDSWFGAHELYKQYWPLENLNISMTPFLPHDYLADSAYQSRDVFGPVLHPLWLTSNGVGILVDKATPLRVSINESGDNQLCLQALPFAQECIPQSFEQTKLHYTLCVHDSISETARYFLHEMIPHPTDVPAKETFLYPIWSTWGFLKTNIDENTVGNYLSAIREHNFNISQLEIDDGYGGNDGEYGDLTFSFDTHDLDSDSYHTDLTAWVHPFVNPRADRFDEKLNEDFFLPGQSVIEGDSISLVRWWHSYGAVINYLNDSVADAQRQDLRAFMKANNLVSLKFDAGEVTYLPKCVFIQNIDDPGDYATAYAQFVGNFSGVTSRAEVRVGYYSQDQPIWVRMLDRASTGSMENGLHSVLTTALVFGMAGYPFVLPDMIGGNGVDPGNLQETEQPSRPLYMRWMQLNVFLPAMQFSIPPYEYDEDVTKHAQDMVELHRQLVEEVMYSLAVNATITGYPIIRPMWWIDSDLVSVNDQFLIGDDIMVAPVLSESDNHRCVHFPNDIKWTRNADNDHTYPGDCTSERSCSCFFNVNIDDVLFFRRMQD